MHQMLSALVLLLSTTTYASNIPSAFNIEEAKQRCTTHFSQSKEVYANDFRWGYTLLEMENRFGEIYDSGKRLNMHSYYNSAEGSFQVFQNDTKMHPVKINTNFIKSVTRQIEVAIANGFADFVFFPDMGHAHLHFPEDHWENEFGKSHNKVKEFPALYEKMLADPKMKALYHLAEQLKMQDEDKNLIQDDMVFFKYWHRNFVGYNNGSSDYQIEVASASKNYNTVGSIEGHKSWSAGFAVSSSKDGCFPYYDKNGQKKYFDIGLQDPRYDPTKKDSEEYGL